MGDHFRLQSWHRRTPAGERSPERIVVAINQIASALVAAAVEPETSSMAVLLEFAAIWRGLFAAAMDAAYQAGGAFSHETRRGTKG
jgi:hypothetical protein